MKDYQVYLFDWDGTLGRTLEMWLEITRTQFRKLGMDPSDTEIAACFGAMDQNLLKAGVPEDKIDAFLGTLKTEALERSLSIDMYAEAKDILEQLRAAGKKMALITTNWRESVNVMLKNHQLEDIFQVVVTGDDVRVRKPDPEGILFALQHLGVTDKTTAVMLGDSHHDLLGATNAGIDSILFYPPSHELFYDFDELIKHQPNYVIDSWTKLRD